MTALTSMTDFVSILGGASELAETLLVTTTIQKILQSLID